MPATPVIAGFAIGVVFGVVGLLSGFCLMSSLRDWWTRGDGRRIRSYALAVAVAICGTQLIAGYGLIFILDRYKLISVPVDVYQISYVPFKLQPFDFIVVIASAIAICFVATIYPSRQAARLDPAQALRYQ